MGANSELYLRLTEEQYLAIPENVRAVHLAEKITGQSINDFEELMQNDLYKELYHAHRRAKKELDDHTYFLREQKRKQLNHK